MHRARNILVATFGFGLGCALLGHSFVRPSQATEMLEFLREHGDDYQVVFLGPSYVEAQIIPRVFDERMASRGHPVRSFNFGIQGMGDEEQIELTRRIAALSLPGLQWLVSDTTLGFYQRFERDNPLHPRTIEWHTLRTFARALRRYRATGNYRDFADHALHTAARFANLGLGVQLLQGDSSPPLVSAPDYYSTPVGKRKRQLGRKGISRSKHRAVMEEISECRPLPAKKTADRVRVLEISKLLDPTALRGAFLIAPVSYRCTVPEGTDAQGRPLVVFAFNDPSRFPELYEAEHRLNENHLNYAGSVLYSRLVADALADQLDAAAHAGPDRRR